jgi:Tryptophan synthase beta chain
MVERVGWCANLLKREDLNHTGSHKVNNTIGQALLANFQVKNVLLRKLAQVSTV